MVSFVIIYLYVKTYRFLSELDIAQMNMWIDILCQTINLHKKEGQSEFTFELNDLGLQK